MSDLMLFLVLMVECIAAVLILGGAGFILVGSIGLVRLPDVFSRLHGPTKATTLGIGSLLIGSVLHSAAIGLVSVHELLVVAFLFLTAPVGAHLIARAALHARRPPSDEEPDEESDGASVEGPEGCDGTEADQKLTADDSGGAGAPGGGAASARPMS